MGKDSIEKDIQEQPRCSKSNACNIIAFLFISTDFSIFITVFVIRYVLSNFNIINIYDWYEQIESKEPCSVVIWIYKFPLRYWLIQHFIVNI